MDSGVYTSCTAVEPRKRIGVSTWRTPDWCPIRGTSVDKFARDLLKRVREGDDMTTGVSEERGYILQACSTCETRCTSSTISRKCAETYDRRCPRCKTETMRIVQWVSVPT